MATRFWTSTCAVSRSVPSLKVMLSVMIAVARALRRHVEHVLNAIDLLLDWRRHRFRYDLRVCARIIRGDLNRRRRNLRILRDRKRQQSDGPDERDDDADHAGKDWSINEEMREVHRIAECGIRDAESGARLRRAVLIEPTAMANSELLILQVVVEQRSLSRPARSQAFARARA